MNWSCFSLKYLFWSPQNWKISSRFMFTDVEKTALTHFYNLHKWKSGYRHVLWIWHDTCERDSGMLSCRLSLYSNKLSFFWEHIKVKRFTWLDTLIRDVLQIKTSLLDGHKLLSINFCKNSRHQRLFSRSICSSPLVLSQSVSSSPSIDWTSFLSNSNCLLINCRVELIIMKEKNKCPILFSWCWVIWICSHNRMTSWWGWIMNKWGFFIS